MPINSVSGNQSVQKQPQLNADIPRHKNSLSATIRQIGESLIHSQAPQPCHGKSPLATPTRKLYAFLAKICLRFKSFFTGKIAASGNNTYDIPPHLPKLAQVAQTRQGFVQIRSGSEKGMGKAILDCLNSPEFGQGIPLSKDQKIVGCHAEKISFCSTQWCLQVYDSAEKEMVEVPLTVINLEQSNPDKLADQLADIKVAMDIHLEAIDPAHRYSVKQPLVMCDNKPQIAKLVVAQEELLSRLYSGQCQTVYQMDRQIDEVLHLISPERQPFKNREEKFAFYSSMLKAHESHSRNGVTGNGTAHAHEIRASRRHMLVPAFPINPMPVNGLTNQPLPGHTTAAPQQAVVEFTPADVSPPTLAGKSPLTRPSLLTMQADKELLQAYREPLKYLQCCVNAVNTFFQSEVVTSEKMASLTIDAMNDSGEDLSGITGLGKPEILNRIARGESITIKKSDFFAPAPSDKKSELNQFDHSTPAKQWRDLINVIKPLGPRKDWVDNADELNSIQELTITPSDWLSAYAEVGLDVVTRVVNDILKTGENNPNWSHLPEDVDFKMLMGENEAARNKEIVNLANAVQGNVPKYMEMGKELSLIVLVGKGQNSGNHFYTISYNKALDRWISLDSAGAEKAGIQDCAEFCKNSELGQALLNHKVQAVVVPQLYAIGDKNSLTTGKPLGEIDTTESDFVAEADQGNDHTVNHVVKPLVRHDAN